MKRAGFTMIELIFVIVILGILAAVAIPKLAATRSDAEVSKAATEVATAVTDIGSYYTAQGAFGAVGAMTNVGFTGTLTGVNGTTATYMTDANATSCIDFDFATDGNLTISVNGSSTVCTALQGAVGDLLTSHNFGGTGVTY